MKRPSAPTEIRASLHELVDEGEFDILISDREKLHAAVDEFVDWTIDAYIDHEHDVRRRLSANMQVMGSVFLRVLVTRCESGEPDGV